MAKILGVLLPGGETAVSAMPLLGKPCGEHVKAAMIAAGANADAFAREELPISDFEILLFAAETTPCLHGLDALVKRAAKSPCALLSQAGAPLAFAMPACELAAFEEDITLPLLMDAYADTVIKIEADCAGDGLAVTDAQSFAAAYQCLRKRIVERHMYSGVIVLDPDRTVIEADVMVGAGTVLYPDNMLQGVTKIGSGCTLYPGSRVKDAVIGDETTVEHSVLLECVVGSHTTVGPFAYLRPKANIGSHCRIGDFVEIKNSNVGDDTKISHLTYVGDGDLGKGINLGCGVVFSNYDGKNKYRTVVDDDAFIGCNVNLIPPRHIGKDAYIAAGSTVDQDVPADALFISRPQGVVKEGWVSRRKEKGKL
jgi:acetyltransferase-like isoleucine patch superfamily enzyme